MNICLSGLAKRTSVFGCFIIPRGKGTWRTIALPDGSLAPEPALPGEADGVERAIESDGDRNTSTKSAGPNQTFQTYLTIHYAG